jgi:hypothetical protein
VTLALRLLVLLFAAELSGMTHAVLDVSASLLGAQHAADDDCDDSEAGHECPPGCPNCHCWHAGTPSPPPVLERGPVAIATVACDASFVPYRAPATAGPDPSCVYRPPRTHTL